MLPGARGGRSGSATSPAIAARRGSRFMLHTVATYPISSATQAASANTFDTSLTWRDGAPRSRATAPARRRRGRRIVPPLQASGAFAPAIPRTRWPRRPALPPGKRSSCPSQSTAHASRILGSFAHLRTRPRRFRAGCTKVAVQTAVSHRQTARAARTPRAMLPRRAPARRRARSIGVGPGNRSDQVCMRRPAAARRSETTNATTSARNVARSTIIDVP